MCGKTFTDDSHFCTKCGKARQKGFEITSGVNTDEDHIKEIVMQLWLGDSNRSDENKSRITNAQSLMQQSRSMLKDPEPRQEEAQTLLDHLVHRPVHPCRVAFDVFGAALILYDVFVLPLSVFAFSESDITTVLHSVSFFYWNLNLAVSFFQSFVENGSDVTTAEKTMARYLKTWFALDALVLLPDWIVFCLEHSSRDDHLDIIRLLRMCRLYRIVKLITIAGRVAQHNHTYVFSFSTHWHRPGDLHCMCCTLSCGISPKCNLNSTRILKC